MRGSLFFVLLCLFVILGVCPYPCDGAACKSGTCAVVQQPTRAPERPIINAVRVTERAAVSVLIKPVQAAAIVTERVRERQPVRRAVRWLLRL